MFLLFTAAPISMVGQNANLGIGTDFPSTELQINVNNNGFNIPMLIRNENGTVGGNGVGIGFVSESAGNWIKAGIFHERTGGLGIGKLHFLTTTATNSSSITLADSRMTIEPGGDVGIGTTSPDRQLEVDANGANNAAYIRITGAEADAGLAGLEFSHPGSNTPTKTAIISDPYNSWKRSDLKFVLNSDANNNDYDIATDDNDVKMIIKNGGNVGIGTTNTTSKLTIDGGIGRTAHNYGHLEGGHNNISTTEDKTSPIYTIGTSYNPTATALSDMYGIGFTHTNSSFITASGNNTWGMYVAADGDARIWLGASANGHSYINTGGNLGIGVTSPQNSLHLAVNGAIRFTNSEENGINLSGISGGSHAVLFYDRWYCNPSEAGYPHFQCASQGEGGLALYDNQGWCGLVSTNNMKHLNADFRSVTIVSDMRLKENTKKISDAFPKLEQIHGYTYNMIDDPESKLHHGVLAQEVQKVYPDMVGVFDKEGHLSVDYTQLVPILVEAVKELKAENEALKTENNNLRAEFTSEIEMIKTILKTR